jgi:hypothetical protein
VRQHNDDATLVGRRLAGLPLTTSRNTMKHQRRHIKLDNPGKKLALRPDVILHLKSLDADLLEQARGGFFTQSDAPPCSKSIC